MNSVRLGAQAASTTSASPRTTENMPLARWRRGAQLVVASVNATPEPKTIAITPPASAREEWPSVPASSVPASALNMPSTANASSAAAAAPKYALRPAAGTEARCGR